MTKQQRRPSKPASDQVQPGDKKEKTKKKKRTRADFGRNVRETVESIVIAVILAFLFRAFEAEAFVIPTGSMAPTLQGRHIDVQCDQCNVWFRTGASGENDDPSVVVITGGCCPVCRYPMSFRRAGTLNADPNHDSFNGDRIIVSKFAYILGDPQRWDIIVFKYPGNPKQNYIKRLIGLPGEKILIRNGNIYTKQPGAKDFIIARKPPEKIKAMLQLVADTDHVGQQLIDFGWPSRWREWSASETESKWKVSQLAYGGTFTIEGGLGDVHWLRYRHIVPTKNEWQKAPPASDKRFRGQLITDFCAYNYPLYGWTVGSHWVGDLAVECNVTVKSDDGEVLLELVEGGEHYTCSIDVATGAARVTIRNKPKFERIGQTKLIGAGAYQLRFSNIDDELQLWVDERVIRFDGESKDAGIQYDQDEDEIVRPHFGPLDPADAEPVGVGSRGAAMEVTRLRVLRDIYYLAIQKKKNKFYREEDYNYDLVVRDSQNPDEWSKPSAFESRVPSEPGRTTFRPFELGDDQFFPMGDNSPSSKDARVWGGDEPFVRRKFLTGKAVLIYWPHSWRRPIPLWPNFKRMNFIR